MLDFVRPRARNPVASVDVGGGECATAVGHGGLVGVGLDAIIPRMGGGLVVDRRRLADSGGVEPRPHVLRGSRSVFGCHLTVALHRVVTGTSPFRPTERSLG